METGEGQDIPSWYCDSDSDDSIVVTISQMQDEAAKLQSTAAEIREELSGLLATLDDIEHRSATDKLKKIPTKAKPESGDGIGEDPTSLDSACPAALKAVDERKEHSESDDRYRDVTTSSTEPPRHRSRGDMTASAVTDSKPFDARELVESLLDAVMERQTGAGDSLDAHPKHSPFSKEEIQSSLKICLGTEGQRSFGDIDGSTHSSDSDDHDVVVSAAALERHRLRRPRKPGSEGSAGSLSSDADCRSSSTADEAFLFDTDAVDRAGGDLESLDGPEGPCLFLD